jgi:tetratricopeptide (TPR) repeat protein
VEEAAPPSAARAPAPVAPPHAPWWSLRRRYLLWLLLPLAAAGAILHLSLRWSDSRARAAMSAGDLRLEAQQHPQDPDLRLRLVERYLWEERNEDAMREAKRAVELAPRSAHAYYLLGKAHQRLRQAQPGIQALERAVRLDPNHAPARFLLGHGYYWNERPLPAAQQFQAYVELQPADDIGFRFLGLAHLHLGNLPAAETALRRAVELEPESSGNRQALGELYLTRAQGSADLERAVEEFVRAIELNPDSGSARLLAAQALERLNRLPEAASHYEALFAKTPTDPKLCYSLLQIYTRLQDTPRAAHYRALYEKIVRAREATRSITSSEPGLPSYPTP